MTCYFGLNNSRCSKDDMKLYLYYPHEVRVLNTPNSDELVSMCSVELSYFSLNHSCNEVPKKGVVL